MSTGRFVAAGKTRSCPHCKATILESAAVCPGCHHHLRFDSAGGQRAQTAETPLRVDGILRHTSEGGAWEYSIVLAIRNGRGEEISRQVVGVGALQPAEERTFSLTVEVFKPAAAAAVAAAAAATRPDTSPAAAKPAAASQGPASRPVAPFSTPPSRPVASPAAASSAAPSPAAASRPAAPAPVSSATIAPRPSVVPRPAATIDPRRYPKRS